jgi:hypothetical protein
MKLFVFKSTLLVSLFIISNILYVIVLRNFDYTFIKANEGFKLVGQDNECIVIGNSCSMDGIDTKLLTDLGITSYNFSLGGATLKTSYIQLSTYLESNEAPKLVLLGLSPNSRSQFDSIGVHPVVDFLYSDGKDWSIKDIPVVKFKWLGKELLKKLFSADHRKIKLERGHFRTERTISDNSVYNPLNTIPKESFLLKFENSTYLSNLDSICRIKDIELLFIELPGSIANRNNYGIDPIYFVAYDGQEMTLFNLNDHFFCDSLFNYRTDWLSEDHLNIDGAKKLTSYLHKEILADYFNNAKF